MAFDYAKMAATALKLLTRFGAPVTLSRETGGAINPVTGEETPGVDASVITTGLLKPYPDKMIDGVRILTGDRELVLSSEQEPQPSDQPVVGGENWKIQGIETISPAGTPVVYFVHVRK